MKATRSDLWAVAAMSLIGSAFVGGFAAHLPAEWKPLGLLPCLLAACVTGGIREILNRWQLRDVIHSRRYPMLAILGTLLALSAWSWESFRQFQEVHRTSEKQQLAAKLLASLPDDGLPPVDLTPKFSDWLNHRVKKIAPGWGMPVFIGELLVAVLLCAILSTRWSRVNFEEMSSDGHQVL